MTPEQKLLISTSLLPVLADFLEDQEFNRFFKHETNNLISRIRKYDKMFLEGANPEEYYQQSDIQIWFRQQCEDAFTVHNE